MHATKRHTVPAATAALALALTLGAAGCASNGTTQDAVATATATPTAITEPATEPASGQPEPTNTASTPAPLTQASPTPTAGDCIGDDYSYAPGGYCLYPAKVTWLDADILPVDPATLDWTDADAVATAYVITANTWDSRVDKSGAYAARRAQIFSVQGRTNPNPNDPDYAKGQAEHVTTWKLDSYTSVEINSIATEGMSPEPLQPDGTWRRVVTYTRTVHTRADGGTPYIKTGAWFLTLAIDPASGEWLITDLNTNTETDVTPESE